MVTILREAGPRRLSSGSPRAWGGEARADRNRDRQAIRQARRQRPVQRIWRRREVSFSRPPQESQAQSEAPPGGSRRPI